MHVAFVGFGLIGGSIARALHGAEPAGSWRLTAWSPTGDGPRAAAADHVIDLAAPSPQAAIEGADVVLLAGPPTTCLDALTALAGEWAPALQASAVVTDVASTKGAIVDRANGLGIRFVGGHPMAGLEVSGYRSARRDLFENRPWAIVAGAHAGPDDPARIHDLANACGARPITLDAASHDRAVAGISHLPLIMAVALVEAVAGGGAATEEDWQIAKLLAAGGWRDMTRLARGDATMGAGIAVTNRSAIRARLADLEAALASWRDQLDGEPDEDDLRLRFEAARRRLEEPA